MDTYPWAASPQQHEWPPLLQLRPEDVGFDGYSMPREGSTSKQMPPSDAEGDPLVSSLLPDSSLAFTEQLLCIECDIGHAGNLEVTEPWSCLARLDPSQGLGHFSQYFLPCFWFFTSAFNPCDSFQVKG